MSRIVLILVAVVIATLIGGTIALSVVNIPPPTAPVEKVIPNDRFPK